MTTEQALLFGAIAVVAMVTVTILRKIRKNMMRSMKNT